MLTPAQIQLSEVNLQRVMGPHGQDPEFAQRLEELSGQIWQNYLYQRVVEELSDEDQDEFARLSKDEAVSQQELSVFLHDKLPELDEQFTSYLLENKAETIRGRIEEVAVMKESDPQAQEKIAKLRTLADEGEWTQVADQLSADYSDVAYQGK